MITKRLFFVTWEHSPDLTRHLSWESVLFHSETDNWGEKLFDGEMKMVCDVCSNGVSHAQSSNIVCTPTSVPISIQATRASALSDCCFLWFLWGWVGEYGVRWGSCTLSSMFSGTYQWFVEIGEMNWPHQWSAEEWVQKWAQPLQTHSPPVAPTGMGVESYSLSKNHHSSNISEELEMLSNYCLKGHFEC